jgi:quinol monooxygenase YgiN
MERKVNTEDTVLAFATYKPKAGQDKALLELVKKHLPILRELQLATDRSNYIAKSKDGTIIEVFEWTSMNAINAAHQHPAVANIWEKMTMIADFIPMNSLPEAGRPFPGFEILTEA